MAGLATALKDPDAVTRGLAAMALRDKGPAAKPALEALVADLKDSEIQVRVMAANAIASIGPEAASAVPALVAVCRLPGETTQMVRASMAALGAIGPAASAALPTLRELAAKPPTRVVAERAIARIAPPKAK
jgi:HEAT repeat protein